MPTKPWTTLDQMRCTRLVGSATLLTVAMLLGGSDSSSDVQSGPPSSLPSVSSQSFSWSSSSSDESEYEWRSRVLMMQMAYVCAAEAPFKRPGVKYARGPRRLSFDRIEEELGGTHSCFNRYRFHFPELRRLLAGLRFPEVARVRGYDKKNGIPKVQVRAPPSPPPHTHLST